MGCAGTHAFLREYAAYISSIAPEAFTVGEVWGSIDAVLPYYPDQLTSTSVSSSPTRSSRRSDTGSAGGMLSGYLRMQDALPAYRWSPFLSNHDGTRIMTTLGGDWRARARRDAAADPARAAVRLLRRGDRDVGRQARSAPPHADAVEQRPRGGIHHRNAVGSPQPDLRPSTSSRGRDPGLAAESLPPADQSAEGERGAGDRQLVPLTAGSPEVAAYLRRSGDHTVLVMANLGAAPVTGVSVQSGNDAIPPGSYAARGLLGTQSGATLVVGADGRLLGYVPLTGRLGPRESAVFDLVRQ